jgi:IS30 family transposase
MPGVRMDLAAREVSALGCARRESFASIGRRLKRPTSTVTREVGRGGGPDAYTATVAQKRADTAARRPRPRSWSSARRWPRPSQRDRPSRGRRLL